MVERFLTPESAHVRENFGVIGLSLDNPLIDRGSAASAGREAVGTTASQFSQLMPYRYAIVASNWSLKNAASYPVDVFLVDGTIARDLERDC